MLIDYEKKLWEKGINNIAGIDEVGRGCLAGPMVVAAVILNPKHLKETIRNNDVSSQVFKGYEGIKDSKLLTPKKRKELSIFIKENAIAYRIEVIENTKIDEWGISKATQIGFFNSIKNLLIKPDYVLTDSFKVNALSEEEQTNIIHGDNLSINIAAASIIAKVFRDELMINLHNTVKTYQFYGFDEHKGYGTKKHMEMIEKHGICDLHRRSFQPIASMVKSS